VDTDHSGGISKAEFAAAKSGPIAQVSPDLLPADFATLDENRDGEVDRAEWDAAAGGRRSMTQEELDEMKRSLQDLGVGVDLGGPGTTSVQDLGVAMAKLGGKEDPYLRFKDLLSYFLGEGVNPDLFPEFPGHAERRGEWYICTFTGKEISLNNIFSQEHCSKMGRPWEEFNKHNPLRHIAAIGSKEKAPWRRVYKRANTNKKVDKDGRKVVVKEHEEGYIKKQRSLTVRNVNDREEWFKISTGLVAPMSPAKCIRDAKPSKHMREGELGIKANPNMRYHKGKLCFD
jgi:hypothetical protein